MLIGTAVVGATTMIFSIIMVLTNGLTENVDKLSLLHPPFLLGLITGGAVIYWFTGASTQAVTTGAYRAVEFIKANIKLDGVEKASIEDSKKVVEICTQYAQKGMFNIFLAVFFATLAFAFLEPFFFIGYLISIALFGLFQAIFMANAGGAWDNAKKIVEVELKEKGTPLHDATVVGDTVGDPFKDTSSVAHEPDHQVHDALRPARRRAGGAVTATQGDDLRARPGGGLLRHLDRLRLPLVLRHADREGQSVKQFRVVLTKTPLRNGWQLLWQVGATREYLQVSRGSRPGGLRQGSPEGIFGLDCQQAPWSLSVVSQTRETRTTCKTPGPEQSGPMFVKNPRSRKSRDPGHPNFQSESRPNSHRELLARI